MLYRFLFLSLTSVFLLACGGGDGIISQQDNGQPTFYKRHPPDPENPGMHLVDSLGYPGNQPTDPVTGKVMPEPVRDWQYVDQLNRPFSSEDLEGKVYVAEFFFISCPTICPKVKGQMLRLEEKFSDHPDFRLVSFTVDPKRDTPEAMKAYAEKMGTKDMDRWRYIHGDKFEIYDLDADYLSIAEENPNAPGGFDHSGYIVLVDRNGFVRSYASGLDPSEVDYLMEDIKLLVK